MSSEAFGRFLRQLHANGPEKGDGFGRSDFEGLDESERAEARSLLVQAIDAGDDTAPDGLVLLDGEGASAALGDAVSRLPVANSARLTAAGALWRLTRDPALIPALAEHLADPHAVTRLIALGILKTAPRDPRLVAPLAHVAEADADEMNRAIAGELLLYTLGRTTEPNAAFREQRDVMTAIKYGDPARRHQTVGSLLEGRPL